MWKIADGHIECHIRGLYFYSIELTHLLRNERVWFTHLRSKHWFTRAHEQSLAQIVFRLKNKIPLK